MAVHGHILNLSTLSEEPIRLVSGIYVLRSANTSRLAISTFKLSTVDLRIWNELPQDVVSAPLLPSPCVDLKLYCSRSSVGKVTF